MHHSLSPFAPSRRPDAHRLNPSLSPTPAVVLESIYPNVGTAHTFTTVHLHGSGLGQKLQTLGCRFGEHVTTPEERAAASVACATPSAGPGFVVVGFARATGKTYTPGRDDISQEQGYNVFEYVEPWRVFTTFPEEASSNVGQKVFLAGRNVRPNIGATISAVGALRCTLFPPPSRCASQSRARPVRLEFSCCSTTHTERRRDNNSRSGDERRRRYRIRDARLCRSASLCCCPPRWRMRAARHYYLGRRG